MTDQPPEPADRVDSDETAQPAEPPPAPAGPPAGYPPPPAGYALAPAYAAPPGYPGPAPAFARRPPLIHRLDPTSIRPTALVALLIIVLFVGSQIVNSVIPVSAVGPGPQPQPGGSIEIGALRVHLFSGWQARQTAEGIPQLAKGSVAVDIHSASFSGDAGALYNTFVDQMAGGGARLTATPPGLVQIGAGLAGARGAYTGFFGSNELEGQLTTFTLGGVGYVFDAWGPMGTLRPLLGEVELMINTIEVRQ